MHSTEKVGQSFFRNVLSYSDDLTDTIFRNCNFNRADLVSAFVKRCRFVGCDMTSMDAAGSEFEDCEFIDCEFRFTSFSKTKFLGCTFRETSRFEDLTHDNHKEFTSVFSKASFFQAQFLNSNRGPCVFDGLFVSSTGFKFATLKNVQVKNSLFYGTSFENCLIEGGTFDQLDLRRSACSYLRLVNPYIKEFLTTGNKLAEIIGAAEVIKKLVFRISFGDDQSIQLENIGSEILQIYEDGARYFADRGCLAPAVNCLAALQHLSGEIPAIIASCDQQQTLIELTGQHIKSEDRYVIFMRAVLENISHQRLPIRHDDIVNLLAVLTHYNIQNNKVGELVSGLALHAINSDPLVDDLTRARLLLAIDIFFKQIDTGRYDIVFTNHAINLDDIEGAVTFARFVRKVLRIAGNDSVHPYALEQGSINERIIGLSTRQVFNIFVVMALLGGEISYSGKDGLSFKYSAPTSTAEKIVDFILNEWSPHFLKYETDETKANMKKEFLQNSDFLDQDCDELKQYCVENEVAAAVSKNGFNYLPLGRQLVRS